MKKLNLSHFVTTVFVILVLYQPIKLITYYLVDFSYDKIMEYMWIYDDMCYYSGESDSGEYDYSKDCSICNQISPYKNNDMYIQKEGNGYIVGRDMMKKIYLKKKPDYISFERFTGGELYVKDLETGITCTFYSYE
ncbi:MULTISPECIES: hypothetical protein [unclassified Gilliamella]|uniref:hypothetical protein n=1 Tax=unclassified Gilliamella TaxID=2685620 RepID=UPI0011473DB5|nr:hypothetical protein [Gilliamella apicola]